MDSSTYTQDILFRYQIHIQLNFFGGFQQKTQYWGFLSSTRVRSLKSQVELQLFRPQLFKRSVIKKKVLISKITSDQTTQVRWKLAFEKQNRFELPKYWLFWKKYFEFGIIFQIKQHIWGKNSLQLTDRILHKKIIFHIFSIDLEQHPERISVPAPEYFTEDGKTPIYKVFKKYPYSHGRQIKISQNTILISLENITFELLIVENKFLVIFY